MAEESKVAEELTDERDMMSLTSSVYTSPLFQIGLDSVYVPGYGIATNSQHGPYPVLFTSDDFVFPPSEHENLPIESELYESNNDKDGLGGSFAEDFIENPIEPHKEVDENSDDNQSVSSNLPSANETTNCDLKLSEIHADQEKSNTHGKSDLPCEGWWQRKSTYVFHHIKGATTVSIVAAGALVGFVIMGQRWQQDRWHLHQFQFSVSSESMNRMMGVFSRLKDGLPGSQQLRSLLTSRVFPQQQLSA